MQEREPDSPRLLVSAKSSRNPKQLLRSPQFDRIPSLAIGNAHKRRVVHNCLCLSALHSLVGYAALLFVTLLTSLSFTSSLPIPTYAAPSRRKARSATPFTCCCFAFVPVTDFPMKFAAVDNC